MSFSNVVIDGEWKSQPAKYRSDQILVAVRDSVPVRDIQTVIEQAIAGVSGAEVISSRRGRRWAIVKVPQGLEAGQFALSLGRHAGIRYAEPDFLMVAHTLALNDDHIDDQDWADTIHLKEAWELLSVTWGLPVGSEDVLLAVLDSGIQMYGGIKVDHPDFDPLRFLVTHKNAALVYVSHDLWKGDVLPVDEDGHGTEVTGILAATPNNARGIAGINWSSKVFVSRVLDDGAHTCIGAVKEAMDRLAVYVEEQGITRVVVNLSLGSTYADEVDSLNEMIEALDPEVFLLCCAPAFWGEDIDPVTTVYHADYPSRYAATKEFVISVGESDTFDKVRTPFGSMTLADPRDVTVVAPGRDAFTTLRHNPSSTTAEAYGKDDGTSMACPMAAGVASLMWSVSPWLLPEQIKSCLRGSATRLPR